MNRRHGRGVDLPFTAATAAIVGSGIVAFLLVGAPSTDDATTAPSLGATMTIPFDLSRPDWTVSLPDSLREISGFAVAPDGLVGLAVNDEEGRLYEIDLVDGAVTPGRTFAPPGDFEGIEIIADAVIVSRSDGALFRILAGSSERLTSPLPKGCDLEGLAYDPPNRRLLAACKGRVGPGRAHRRARALYAARLPAFEWDHAPTYVIRRPDLRALIERSEHGPRATARAKHFAPSAVAVDPIRGHVYVLSTTGRVLVVLDGQGTLIGAAPLSRDVHPQPEGMAFDREGTLYITNEGRRAHARLSRFDRKEVDHVRR